MSVLSHLRRVISPLSRSQPHFEARDLHPTQWGRICPSETPEGPNCGLVKNFAQMVEISRGVPDEDEVTRMLYNLGVEHIRGDMPMKKARVFVDGALIGLVDNPRALVTQLRHMRRHGALSIEVNISYKEFNNDVVIHTDRGRARRPLIVLQNGKTVISPEKIEKLARKETGRLQADTSGFDLLRDVFPGGTITGVPKIRCMEVIEELEPVRRGPYTGSMGYFSWSGDLDFNIVIRTLVLREGQGYLQVGAGIVADSDPAKEYEETIHKAQAFLSALS